MKFLLQTLVIAAVAAFSGLADARFSTVVIDPGHGGHDKGGQWGHVYEKHLALDTAVRLEQYLKRAGLRTVMTRRSDYFVTLPDRVKIANRFRNAIFVSVHYNYTWKTHICGLETFYCTQQSAGLANAVHWGMNRHVRCTNRGVKYARYYVIRNTNIPAVLVECGFVSNATERERMKRAWYRDAMARGIAEGIIRYRKGR